MRHLVDFQRVEKGVKVDRTHREKGASMYDFRTQGGRGSPKSRQKEQDAMILYVTGGGRGPKS